MQSSPNSIGSYSIATSFSLPWKKERPRSGPIEDTKKRKKTLKPIIHPIFESCVDFTDDKFWRSTFLDCAKGKFPRGYSFKNNLLTYKKGNKINNLEIDTTIKHEVFYNVKTFFQNCSGIMSAADRKYKQQQEEQKMLEEVDSYEDMTWKDIRTEKLKEIIIAEFISSLCTRMKYNDEEKKELTTVIKKGLMLKYFNGDNIIMKGGKIIEIDGLIYNKENNMYEIEKSYLRKTERKCSELGIEVTDKKLEIDFLEIWRKYLESLENKRIKKSTTFSSSNILNNDSNDTSQSYYI